MLSDIEAIRSNWLHLHDMIALSCSTCGKQDNQNKKENIQEELEEIVEKLRERKVLNIYIDEILAYEDTKNTKKKKIEID